MKSGITDFVQQAARWFFDQRNAYKVALLLFAVAVVFRASILAMVPNANVSTNAAKAIIGGASLIRSGHFIANAEYPTLIPPLPAIVTAALQSVFGEGLLSTKLLQVVLDAVTVVILFYVGRLVFPYAVAGIGALLLAVYPYTAFTSAYIGSEVLFTLFIALFVLASLLAIKKENSFAAFLVAGICLGCATMSRGTTQYFPIFFLAFLAWHHRSIGRKFLRQSAFFLLGFALIVGPWVARNFIVLDAFIPSSTAGVPLLNGSSEEFWEIDDREREFPLYVEYLKKEKGLIPPRRVAWVEKDKFHKQAAIEKYRQRLEERPLSFIPFLAEKFARMWYATEVGHRHGLILLSNLPFYLFGIAGLWLLMRSGNRAGALITVLLGYFIVIHVLVYSLFRYTLPVMPYVILLSVYGFVHLKKSWLAALNRQNPNSV